MFCWTKDCFSRVATYTNCAPRVGNSCEIIRCCAAILRASDRKLDIAASLANLAGFAGPYLMGWLKHATGGYAAGLGVLAAGLLMTAVTIFLVGRTLEFRIPAVGKFAPPA